MKGSTFISAAAATASLLFSVVSADCPPIEIKGTKFFYKNNGTQFFIKGVAYQQEAVGGPNATASDPDAFGFESNSGNYRDPLTNPKNCKRDIPYLKELNTNAVRVYSIKPEEDHDECMKMFCDAGIYVVADLSAPDQSIIRNSPSWDDDLHGRYTSVIDTMGKYDNTLAFFAGNEVSNTANTTDASAFVKAAIRDSKAYIKSEGLRPIPVGYATADDKEIRTNMAKYFNCGDPEQSMDFWGYNVYSWCGDDSSMQKSGYDVRTEEFSKFNVPAFFAEYGCNTGRPKAREFLDVPHLFGPEMNEVWSGGMIYMFHKEENDFGLVEENGDDLETTEDFDNLKKLMAKVNPKGVNRDQYTPSGEAQDCPALSATWMASEDLPPTPDKSLCECMEKASSCVASKSLDDEDMGDLFGTVCGADERICAGITANATEGTYGAYSMCNPRQKMAWALGVYYAMAESSGNGADACDFDGAATSQQAQSPSGDCKSLMDEAGTDGTGSVSSSNSGGSGSDSSNTDNGAPSISHPSTFGMAQAGIYVVVGLVSGIGMIWL